MTATSQRRDMASGVGPLRSGRDVRRYREGYAPGSRNVLAGTCISTYSSWINQVERFFAILTDKAIRRDSFTSVKELTKNIDSFVSRYNEDCKPFSWTATADSILEEIARLCGRIAGTGHQRICLTSAGRGYKKRFTACLIAAEAQHALDLECLLQ